MSDIARGIEDLERSELIALVIELSAALEDERQKCQTCRTLVKKHIEEGRRARAQHKELTKKEIIELQRKGVFIPPGRRSRVVDDGPPAPQKWTARRRL